MYHPIRLSLCSGLFFFLLALWFFMDKPGLPETSVILADQGVIVKLQMPDNTTIRGIPKTIQPGLLIIKNKDGIRSYAPAEMLDAKDRRTLLSENTNVYVFEVESKIVVSSTKDVDWKSYFSPETKSYAKFQNFLGIFVLCGAFILWGLGGKFYINRKKRK